MKVALQKSTETPSTFFAKLEILFKDCKLTHRTLYKNGIFWDITF